MLIFEGGGTFLPFIISTKAVLSMESFRRSLNCFSSWIVDDIRSVVIVTGYTIVSSGSANSLQRTDSNSFSAEPPCRSVRPLLPMNSVSPVNTAPGLDNLVQHSVCPGVASA